MLLAGLIAGWFAALRPELNERAATRGEADRLTSRLAAHRAAASGLATWRERVETLQRRIHEHPMHLPREPDLPGLLGRVAGIATATDTRLVGVEPADAVTTADYRQRPVTLRLEGHWDALVELLTRLGHETRAVTMTHLGMVHRSPEADGPPLALTLTVNGYWRRPGEALMPTSAGAAGWIASDPMTAGDRPAALNRNPFEQRAIEPENTPNGLTYLGRIRIGERVWALLRDAGGDIHPRQPGTTLPGGGRLEQVKPTAIIVNRPGGGENPDAPGDRLRIELNGSGG